MSPGELAGTAEGRLRDALKRSRELGLQTVAVRADDIAELLDGQGADVPVVHVAAPPAKTAVRADPAIGAVVQRIVGDFELRGIPIYRARWAPEDCTCPWPWPLEDGHVLPDCPAARKGRGGS